MTRLLLLAVLLHAPGSAAAPARQAPVLRSVPGHEALVVRVVAAGTGQPLPARVVVRDAAGEVVASRYEQLPGLFTDEQGTLEMPLRPGAYTVEALRGIDSLSKQVAFRMDPGRGSEVRVALEPWLRLRALGWANGDAHAHLYSDTPADTAMLATVRRICLAQGVDFLCACQTWAGFAGASWREGFAAHSDARFRLLYGAELPKYRTGHTFWFGLDSTRGLFEEAMDVRYEDGYYQSPTGSSWTFDSLPFPAIPDVALVSRLREAEDAVAVVPHPTSWWWQKRGEVEKYVTNVAVSLPAGLLAGGAWAAMVVMGYDRDQDFYEDLWFHVLDEGYRMAAVGELDGGYGPDGAFYYGRVRTYAEVGTEVDRGSLVRAVRANHTFVTSGPVVLARLGAYEPGDVVPADGRARELRLRAFASGDRRDRLSYVVLFRNGRVHRLWDLRRRALRRFETRLSLREPSAAWYVLKAYSGKAARAPEQLDVRANAERIAAGTFPGTLPAEGEVCLTSPFYFRRPGEPVEPAALRSRLRLQFVDPASGAPVKDVTLRVLVNGRPVDERRAPLGALRAEVPAGAVLVLEAPGRPPLRRTLLLDYPPLRDRLERLASGAWLADFGGRGRLQPGQVPWRAFGFAETKALLADVDWTVRWQPNERDARWPRFESAFE